MKVSLHGCDNQHNQFQQQKKRYNKFFTNTIIVFLEKLKFYEARILIRSI